MKKLVFASAIAACTLTGSAHAQDSGPYVTIQGGAVKQQRADVEIDDATEHSDRFKVGWEAGGAFGYDFGNFRLEAEGFYKRSALNEQERPVGSPLPNGTFDRSDGLDGHTNTIAGMANALLSVGDWGGIKAYAGGGVGYARTRIIEVFSAPGQVNDHDTGFAWQALAGLTAPISDNIDFGLKYRYFRPDGADDFIADDGTRRQVSLRSHSLLATLTYNFGGRPAMPEVAEAPAYVPVASPAPAPPPPASVVQPAPAAATCNRGPFIVFFDWDKADVTVAASGTLDSALRAYGNCGSVAIMLAGHTDASGTTQYNLRLSERRNEAVQRYLAGRGIAASSIDGQGYGENNQRVPTADGVRELQNRRVEITYGPGSGY